MKRAWNWLAALMMFSPAHADTAAVQEIRTAPIRFRLRDASPILEITPVLIPDPDPHNAGENRVTRLEIREAGHLVQTLPVPGRLRIDADKKDLSARFDFQDCCFRGSKDIVLYAWPGIMGNTVSYYWLYDPATRGFVFNSQLSGLSAVSLDPVRREINTRNQSQAGASHTLKTLRWRGTQLVLEKEERQSPLNWEGPLPLRLAVDRYIRFHGRMHLSESLTLVAENHRVLTHKYYH